MFFISIILFFVVGALMGIGGISITEKPDLFIPITLLIVAIDAVAVMRGRNERED